MDEPINSGRESGARRAPANEPPELNKRLLDPWATAITGTSAWFVTFLVLLVAGVAWLWIYTAVAGTVIGCLGMALMYWQRSASRRGRRSAQRGI